MNTTRLPFSTIIFDLSEVLITGLLDIEKPLARRLGASPDGLFSAFGGQPLTELFCGRMTEDAYLVQLIEGQHRNWGKPSPGKGENRMNSKTREAITGRINKQEILTILKWGFIVLFVVATVLDGLNLGLQALEPIAKVLIFAIAWIHGIQRYSTKNMLIWFGITWLVSNFFESLSIATGFPYGHYHYEIPGPRIANVPVLIMPSYFGMGYIAWTLAQILTGQYHKKLAGSQKIIVPLTAAFITTAYDVVTDPIASTVHSRWIWRDGGAYFGVPLTNFAGWLFVVFCYQQIFALFISRDAKGSHTAPGLLWGMIYWLEPVLVYFVMGLLPVIQYFTHSDHVEIFGSMALVSVFTMILIAMLSYFTLRHHWSRGED